MGERAKEKLKKMNTSQRLCPMGFIIARFVDGAGSSTGGKAVAPDLVCGCFCSPADGQRH